MRKLKERSIHLISVAFLFVISLNSILAILLLNSLNSEDNLSEPSKSLISNIEFSDELFYEKLGTSSYSTSDLYVINTSLYHIPKTLWVRQTYNFTFEYLDILSEPPVKLGELDEAYYQWYRVSVNGSIISPISNKTDLIEFENTTYILDFNTTSREVGDYVIFVTLYKDTYDVRIVVIDLTIQKRNLTVNFTATNLNQNQIRINQGSNILFELTLTDSTEPANPQPIADAFVILSLGLEDYPLNGTNGTYTYTLTTSDINTFFTVGVFTGEISITREDYVPESIPITIVVEMIEIFPGMPLFYFIMLIGSIVAIIISLVAYRVIQLSRISKFVKKARKMKREIKGKKMISDSLLYPSKSEFIVQKLGYNWEMLGLSLERILDIESIKKKKSAESIKDLKKVKTKNKGSKKPEEKNDSIEGES